jgi:hypothetical protein
LEAGSGHLSLQRLIEINYETPGLFAQRVAPAIIPFLLIFLAGSEHSEFFAPAAIGFHAELHFACPV